MVGILDHVLSNTIQPATGSCVFNEFGRCSTTREFGIICRNHADQILGIALIEDIVSTGLNDHKTYKISATEKRDIFLPFPFKFNLNNENINPEVPPCLDKIILQEKTLEYVSQMNLPSPEARQRVVSALMCVVSDGSFFLASMPRASFNFQTFCTPGVKAYLEKRWEKTYIYVKHTVNNRSVLEKFPMKKMPLFYQIILCYVTMSVNILENNITNRNEYEILQPRIILNADKYRFEYINTNEQRPLLLRHRNTSFSSPLILAGYHVHPYKIELFKQNALILNYSVDNISGFCDDSSRSI
uniref:HzNVORF89-like protein n=1 Tax=Chelonus inanitus TaxID=49201 RepID=B9W4B6_9HYME|nr:HzNVORF89-like protein [Chelonus inanitus]